MIVCNAHHSFIAFFKNVVFFLGGTEECKKRWASVHDQYRRTLQKRKTKSGQPAVKNKPYKYENVLEFLLPHVVDRETLSNVPSLDDSRSDETEFDRRMEETELAELDNETEMSESILASSQEDDFGPSTHTTQLTAPVTQAGSKQATSGRKHNFARPANLKRKLPNPENSAYESPSSQLMAYILAEKQAEKNNTNQNSNQTHQQQHPVDIFLLSLALALKSLDPLLLNQAKTVLFATVQDFELKQMTKNDNRQQMMTTLLRLDLGNHGFSMDPSSNNSSPSSSTNESTQYNSPPMGYNVQSSSGSYFNM